MRPFHEVACNPPPFAGWGTVQAWYGHWYIYILITSWTSGSDAGNPREHGSCQNRRFPTYFWLGKWMGVKSTFFRLTLLKQGFWYLPNPPMKPRISYFSGFAAWNHQAVENSWQFRPKISGARRKPSQRHIRNELLIVSLMEMGWHPKCRLDCHW